MAAGHRVLPVGPVGLAALALCALAACAPEPPRSLLELERMGFVPAGQGRVVFGLGAAYTFGAERDLLVDLYEVSRADWAHYFGEPPPARDLRGELSLPGPGREAWPAFADFPGARELARRRGMRLPLATEWLWISLGPRGQRYPWGRVERASVANTLDLGVRRPLPGGALESGRGPFGHYDLVGNVWEWVEGELPGFWDPQGPFLGAEMATVVGGGYLTRQRELVRLGPDGPRFFAQALPRGTRSVEIGLRCAVDAEDYLMAHAAGWGRQRRRLTVLGERWGPAATPLLQRLTARPGAPTPLFWLLDGTRR